MNNDYQLSKESEDFIGNLNVYLFSSGKKSAEIEDIVEELTDHLVEAEKNGKSANDIIGQTPAQYMEMISNEMPIDYREWMKYILLIVIGSFSIKIFPDLLDGYLAYSVLELAGFLVITAIFLGLILLLFKKISRNNWSDKKIFLVMFIFGLVTISLFIGLIYLNRHIITPILYFGQIGSIITGVAAALILIGLSFWARTWIFVMVVSFLTIPTLIFQQTSLPADKQLLYSAILMNILFISFIIYSLRKNKEE